MSIRTFRSYFYYLSRQANYVFIHIPKNAGVTIRHNRELRGRVVPVEGLFLVNRNYRNGLLKTMQEDGAHHGIGHARIRDVSLRIRKDLRPFAVIRNPWARVVSRHTFANRISERYPNYPRRSFDEFLEERHIWGGREFYWHRAVRGWFPQVDYVTDENGARPVDILRAEHLDDEATRYFGLRAPLGRRNVSNRTSADYRSFYTPRTIQIVADWYAADIETFSFDFDTPATRNFHFEGR